MMDYIFGSKNESVLSEKESISEEFVGISYLNKCIYSNNNVSYYITDIRDFVNEISTASCQRCIDNEHVEKLTKDIKMSKHCVGTFKLVQLNDKIDLIDGQHRVMALKNIISEDGFFNIELILEVYNVNNESEKRELFRNANNVKNIEEFDIPDEIYANVVDTVVKNLKNKFRYKNGNDCIRIPKIVDKSNLHRPNVDEQKLTKALIEYTKNKNIKDVDIICDKIYKLNNEYGMKKHSDFKPPINTSIYNKAKDCCFYLGLEKDVSIWVQKI